MFALMKTVLDRVIKKGNLTVTDSKGITYNYGDGSGEPVHVRITSPKWEKEIALDPALKFGEAYMDGGFIFEEGDIYQLLEIIFESTGPNAENQVWMRALSFMRVVTKRFAQMNNLRRSSKNVQYHYDLSGALYDLFLDPDRQYSCAYFENPQQSLSEAQLAKKRHLAAKLSIKPNEKLLDIGCGWGGLGLYMARFLGADVTGVTLSHEQYDIANQRAAEMQLQDKARFLLQDYRNLNDKYDKMVSVGMFEHVGVGHYKEYFSHVKRLLKPDGVFVLHSIGRMEPPGATNPFIAKYIFPGGYIPALSEVLPVIEKSGLYITDIEILRLHYAETLKAWRKAFLAHWDEAKALYDERFCRMWDFYLAASESAFRWQGMMVFQIQLAHKQEAVPLTRDYIQKEETRLRALDKVALDELKGSSVKDVAKEDALIKISNAKLAKKTPMKKGAEKHAATKPASNLNVDTKDTKATISAK